MVFKKKSRSRTQHLKHSGTRLSSFSRSERGLPFAQDGIRTSRADAWNQDWEWMGRHWGATLISGKNI